MNITNSPDISVFQVKALFDLSVTPAVIRFENLSTGAHLANVDYVFEMRSPNGIAFYTGNFTTPDRSGVWTNYNSPAVLPKFQDQIEWSEINSYTVIVKAKDSAGTIYPLPAINVVLSKPFGNSTTNYGVGVLDISVDCNQKEARIKDITPYLWRGIDGKKASGSDIIVVAPEDSTGVTPDPVHYEGYSQVTHPLTISGTGYKAVLISVIDYAVSDLITVRLRYTKSTPFEVNCNYDLAPLLHEFHKMNDLNQKICDDKITAKLNEIARLLVQAVIAKLQPASGFDLGLLIAKIKKIGGWNCECNVPIGLNGDNTYTPGGNSYQFEVGGDIAAGVDIIGNNVKFTIEDYTYVIGISNDSEYTNAFEFTGPVVNNRTKTFGLRISLNQLTDDILDNIHDTPAMLDMFNSLVRGNFSFTVDAKCILNTNQNCTYTLTLSQIPSSPSNAIFKSIIIDGISYNIGISFSRTSNLAALKTKLDSLNKGTFSVTVSNTGVLTVVTTGSKKVQQAIVYGAATTTDRTMELATTGCTGTVVYEPSEIIQALVDYLCAIKADQVSIGYDFTFHTLNSDGTVKDVSFLKENSLKDFIEAVNSHNALMVGVLNSKVISYQAFINLFNDKTSVITPTDVIFGTRSGKGGMWTITEMIQEISRTITTSNDAGLKSVWCAAINICNGSSVCNPVDYAALSIRSIVKDDFGIVANTLVFTGYYNNHNLPATTTINLRQVDEAGNPGASAAVTMNSGTNRIVDLISAAGSPATGFKWTIDTISGAGSNKYLALAIRNNGAGSFDVATRVLGSGAPFTYTAFPRQAGPYTNLLFAVPQNNYEADIKAVCGVNSKSASITVSNLSCPAPTTFNVTRAGFKFLVSYNFPSSVTEFILTETTPTGGVINTTHSAVSGGGSVEVQASIGQYGDYKFKVRAACDAANGWFGPYSNELIVSYSFSGATPPTVVAGADATITQPTGTANLDSTITAGTNDVVSVLWTLLTGPNGHTAVITNPAIEDTTATGLATVAGDYTFQIEATDNGSLTASDQKVVHVLASSTPQLGFTTQPTSQNITSGNSFGFSVAWQNGTGPYTVTYHNNRTNQDVVHSNVSGTSDTLTGQTASVTETWTVTVADSASNVITSNVATITVPLILTYGYGPADLYVDNNTAITIPNAQTMAINSNTPWSVPFPTAAQDQFLYLRFDAGQADKTAFSNPPAPNSGVIPGQEFRAIFTVAGQKYLASRSELPFDATGNLVFE